MLKIYREKSKQLIKRVEGFSKTAYKDADGYSIGYGHFIVNGDNIANGDTITETYAETLLDNDMDIAHDVIARYVKVGLNPNQYAALMSFVYNIGEPQFSDSTLLKRLNSGDFAGAANEFDRWNKTTINGQKVVSKSLVNRRLIEKNLFNQRNIHDI